MQLAGACARCLHAALHAWKGGIAPKPWRAAVKQGIALTRALFLPPAFVSAGTYSRKGRGMRRQTARTPARVRAACCDDQCDLQGRLARASGQEAGNSDGGAGGAHSFAPLGLQRQPVAGLARSPAAAAPVGGRPDPRASQAAAALDVPAATAGPVAPARTLSRPAKAGQGRAMLPVDGRGSSGGGLIRPARPRPWWSRGSWRLFGTSGPFLGERRQSHPCVAIVGGPTGLFPASGGRAVLALPLSTLQGRRGRFRQ
jgi:hypothetical protein